MISVIIPTCNRNKLLSNCLEKLKRGVQTIDAGRYEVIITDDSRDGTATSLIHSSYPWVKCVDGPCLGPAANRNNGATYAANDWLVFIDDDCVPDESLLEAYYEAITLNGEIEVFEGYVGVDRDRRSFIEESPINETGGFLWSCNFMIAKKLFEELNGFDPNFPYAAMEDVDLRHRIKGLNKEIKFVARARVIHPWRSENAILSKTRKRFKSILYFVSKYPEARGKLNHAYFLKVSANYLKNMFRYAFKFKGRGLDKQFTLSLMHLYFAFILLLKNIRHALKSDTYNDKANLK